ncbi:hypothetical protein Daura_47325 [Dactylosporangium aurantiacum]|uniref:Uncharacterized protein n=1 Tax=Dactylosporangium aurantiacum TaxID=35754 RepID=A0A9Q9IJR6_9ACTN|nr:hypothetical protein [Dactylosporangium aurantiacum]MDG6105446.1 hypothetical protein [Dactylosporangium aurantiacum]UWZ54015.1 hypothetical protein Daura_47325 [Dactylosporangium aurantiacum]
MSLVHSWRGSRLATFAGTGTAAAALLSAATLVGMPMAAHAAPAATSITIASPVGGKVAADTAKQVVIINVVGLTGATLDEASVASVDLGADADCQGLDFYIVTGTTSIAVKTPDPGGCAPTSGVASETIAINFTNGVGTLTKTLSGLIFVTPPALDSTTPVITDLSSELPSVDQIQQFAASGGQVIRVKADSGFAFTGQAGQLTATLGGKPLTEIKVYKKTDGTLLTTAPSNTENGNWFTGKTAAGMSGANLAITHNGVTKTFAAADIGTSVVAVPAVTTMNPTSGKINAATTVTLTGTFTGATGVTFCGVAGTNFVLNAAATSITVKTPTTGLADDAAGLGTGVFSGVCPVKVQGPNGTVNVHTPLTAFSFLAE